jgi:hypothetical protein
MAAPSKLRQTMKRREKSLGDCDLCGQPMAQRDYPADGRPRLKGVCWHCMEEIDKHPARGKRTAENRLIDLKALSIGDRLLRLIADGKNQGGAYAKLAQMAYEAFDEGDLDYLIWVANRALRHHPCAGWVARLDSVVLSLRQLKYSDTWQALGQTG